MLSIIVLSDSIPTHWSNRLEKEGKKENKKIAYHQVEPSSSCFVFTENGYSYRSNNFALAHCVPVVHCYGYLYTEEYIRQATKVRHQMLKGAHLLNGFIEQCKTANVTLEKLADAARAR